jgi:hypothetical protein
LSAARPQAFTLASTASSLNLALLGFAPPNPKTLEADAQRRLFSMHCENDKKMQEHLDRLAAIKEEIAEAGIVFADKTYTDAIIESTPASYLPIVQAYEAAI